MNKQLAPLLVVLTATTTLVACGPQHTIPQEKLVHRAPTSESETGVIVSGLSDDDVTHMINQDNNLMVRVVNANHNLYEFYGASETEIKDLVAKSSDKKVIVEKNKFKTLNVLRTSSPNLKSSAKHPFAVAIEKNQGVKVEGEFEAFINSCKLNKFAAPKVNVNSNKGRDRMGAGILFDVKESITLDASQSTAALSQKPLEFLWIVTTPEDSALGARASFKKQIEYAPDTTGMYIYSVIAKDGHSFCGIDMAPFYVTANDAFDSSNAFTDDWYQRIDEKTFWHVFHVGAQAIWQRAVGALQVVGVIDTGVDYNHPALSKNIRVNTREIPNNGIDDDNNGFIDDYVGYDFGNNDAFPFDDYGHGTHVAGIAASHVFGAARKAQILPTKFGAGLGFDIASITGAIQYSVDQGATVLNMSFGWEEDLEVVREVMNYAEKKGVLVVAAAGNDGANNEQVGSFPCNYPNANIISVAASDENNALTFYSNYGRNVHLAAPGGTPQLPIMSAYKKNPQENQFVGLMGTSMASPLVAGVAAQIWSANPNLTAVEVKKILLETGRKSDAIGDKVSSGRVIDAEAALNRALETRPESSNWL